MNRKLKIIQVSAIDFTMDKLLRRLNELSIEEGYDVIGVCSKGEKTQKLIEEGFNIKNINIDRSIKPISNIKSIIDMYKLFKNEKPDIVHVHTPVAAVLGRIAAKLAKVSSIVYTAHGFYFHENMNKFTYNIFLNIEKVMAKYFTDFIFTQSKEDKDTALENGFIEEDKIISIGNGVDVWSKFNPSNVNLLEIEAIRQDLGIDKDDKVICFVGRLVKEKGIFDLLEGFNRLKQDNIKLIVIGGMFQGDRDNETVNKINEFKSNKNIIFTGTRNDINNLLYISDIFCLPSYREGMPRSIIEAMAMNCAVIATNIRGSREEVLDGITGYLVDLNSPDQIADKLNTLLSNEDLLNTMKIEGRKEAEKVYDEDVVVKKQLEIFEKLTYKKLKSEVVKRI